MDIQNIPWRTIDAKLSSLGPSHNQAWLARQLNVGTNVIANWRSRGGAPLSRASDLAKVLECTTDELLLAPKTKKATSTSSWGKIDSEESLLKAYKELSRSSQQELHRFAEFLRAKENGLA